MGDTVFRDFGEDLYTIAVTCHHGTTGQVWPQGSGREPATAPVPPAPAGSFEDLAHRTGERWLFVDLRHEPPESFLRQRLLARPLGMIPIHADWSRVVDAFLFLDEMTPEHRRLGG